MKGVREMIGIKPTWTDDKYGVELYLADCMDVLPTLGKVDAVVTDPPYGIGYKSGRESSWKGETIAGDHDTASRDEALLGFEIAAVFGSWKTKPIEDCKAVLIWDKGPASGMGDLSIPWKLSWEMIFIRGRAWSGFRDEGIVRGHRVVTWESQRSTLAASSSDLKRSQSISR